MLLWQVVGEDETLLSGNLVPLGDKLVLHLLLDERVHKLEKLNAKDHHRLVSL